MLSLLLCLELCACFLFSSASLYDSSDDVIILSESNFTSVILDTENAWIVEFYSSWCGHCIHFAPTWKKFATDIKDWQHTIKVAVIDCAADENVGTCRNYEVMGYPSIRLFASHVKKGDVGKDIRAREISQMGDSMIDFLSEQQKSNNGSPTWANLQPYQGPLEDIWKEVPESAENVVLIIDGPDSKVAKAVIMDLGGYSNIAVRYKEADAGDISMYGAGSLPVVTHIDKTKNEKVSLDISGSREEIKVKLMEKFNLKRSMLPYKTFYSGIKDDIEGAGDGRPEEINSDKLNYEDDLDDDVYTGGKKDQVYMVDIENAISYALSHEAVQHKVISGQALSSLQEFLNVLVKYLPTRPPVHKFLTLLHEYTLSENESISGEVLANKIKSLQDETSLLPRHQSWMGCRGSSDKYRGYPCGLWTTFHTLTVNAVLQDGHSSHFNPKKVLKAIHGYVRDFFGCKYCSKHFQEMYKVDGAETTVNIADDGILWLWRAHNKVNKRLSGDASEDPEHPKQQFPVQSACPSCSNGESFNEKEVLIYLKSIYAKGALSFEGTQEFSGGQSKNRQAKVKEALDNHRNKNLGKDSRNESLELQKLDNAHWSFNMTDISLCVLLYGLSTVIILVAYCVVVIRRRIRRQKFIEMYKQP